MENQNNLCMGSIGRVVGGAYLDGNVAPATFGSDLVVQSGFKGRKLTVENVAAWQEPPVEAKDNAFTAMGKAAAGVALPGRLGRAASAAVGAALDSKKPDRHVRIDWIDGKQSLLKLPDALFTHLELVLADRRTANVDVVLPNSTPEEIQPTIADKTFDLVSDIVKDRFPSKAQPSLPNSIGATAQIDVAEQLHKLASLRDAGILTDDEFVAKKTELLTRF